MKPRIIWQSKWFPKLILTNEHLEFLKDEFPSIKQYHPEFKKMEIWLDGNKEKQPKKNWRKFINNWMRKAVEIQKERAQQSREPQYGDSARSINDAPKLLSEILKRSDKY